MRLMDILMLPVKLWYSVWTLPDEVCQGRENDLITTVCYITLKIIWILVSILLVWLTICPLFGF